MAIVGMTVLFVLLLGTLVVGMAAPAFADMDGPCTLVVNGRDVRSVEVSPSDAFAVTREEALTGFISSPSDFQSFEVLFLAKRIDERLPAAGQAHRQINEQA